MYIRLVFQAVKCECVVPIWPRMFPKSLSDWVSGCMGAEYSTCVSKCGNFEIGKG